MTLLGAIKAMMVRKMKAKRSSSTSILRAVAFAAKYAIWNRLVVLSRHVHLLQIVFAKWSVMPYRKRLNPKSAMTTLKI